MFMYEYSRIDCSTVHVGNNALSRIDIVPILCNDEVGWAQR